MSYYRDTYLKSKEWRNLRLERLYASRFTCELCGEKNCRFDVHHLEYKNLFGAERKHLRTLCRKCHQQVHVLLLKYPKLKTLPQHQQWLVVLSHLKKDSPLLRRENKRIMMRIEARTKEGKSRLKFSKCRNVIVSMRLVKRSRFIWTPDVVPIRKYLKCPIRFLTEYVRATGIDPRYRTDRIGPHKLLPTRFGH